jgi:hypothetical protein
MTVVLCAIATAIVLLDVWATRVVVRQIDLPGLQRRAQVIFVWLVPIIGALIALEIHRRAKSYQPRARLAADEINPVVNEALRLLADAATRAFARVIEQEAVDFAEHAGHAHSDGSY